MIDLPIVLAGVAFATLFLALRADLRDFARFQTMAYTHQRRGMYLWWVVKYAALFGVQAVAGLAILGRLDTLVALPPEFEGLRDALRAIAPGTDIAPFLIGAAAGGLIGGGVIGGILAARGPEPEAISRGPQALVPRNGGEIACTALLSVNAGVTEELFFRLYLPLVWVMAGGEAITGFVIAGALFGVAHLYQGVAGIVTTMAIGALLALVYLFTGDIWIAVAAHVVIDLVALVLRPAITNALRHRARAQAGRSS